MCEGQCMTECVELEGDGQRMGAGSGGGGGGDIKERGE